MNNLRIDRKQSSRLGIAILFAALWYLTFAFPLHAAATPQRTESIGECRALESHILGRSIPYCVLLPSSYRRDQNRRYPVLYFLHGLGDNEQMFLRSGGLDLIDDLRVNHEIGDFLIVTPAGGSSFYINSRNGRLRYEDFFLEEFIPAIERSYRVHAGRAYRGIAGISMGGYGALHLAFAHPDLFGSVSAHSAALIERLPAIAAGESVGMPAMRLLGNVFGSPPDRPFWDRNNPIVIARAANLKSLKIYFDCGAQDDYGFYAGAKALDQALSSRGIPHEFHLYPGGHDWQYFAAHLPASLAFESRAFGEETASSMSSN